MPRPTSATREHLTLRIDLDDVDVPVWRSLILDPALDLSDLAEAILLAFGWTGTGTWRFGTSHTPWWGRDADAWGCGVLTPARLPTRPRHVSPQESPYGSAYGGSSGSPYGSSYGSGYGTPSTRPYEYDDWSDHESEPTCRRAWTIGQVTDRFDGRLEFEYRQLELDGEHGEPGPSWRHRISVTGRDGASSRSSIPRAALLGGGGTVPRVGTEGAYGELGDPSWHEALGHEFELTFGASSDDILRSGTHGRTGFDAAITGASDAARRALRIDLVRLGVLAPVRVEPAHVTSAMAPIRELLRAATAADGIDLAECGPLGDDLRVLGLARVQKGRLRTLAFTRDHLLDDPAALWASLTERLIRPGHSPSYSRQPEVAEFAVDLVLGDETGHDVRRYAFDEAQGHAGPRRIGDADLARVKRMLHAMGLTDQDGRAIHPAARAFGLAMIRS